MVSITYHLFLRVMAFQVLTQIFLLPATEHCNLHGSIPEKLSIAKNSLSKEVRTAVHCPSSLRKKQRKWLQNFLSYQQALPITLKISFWRAWGRNKHAHRSLLQDL